MHILFASTRNLAGADGLGYTINGAILLARVLEELEQQADLSVLCFLSS
jgi:hypothetical protein